MRASVRKRAQGVVWGYRARCRGDAQLRVAPCDILCLCFVQECSSHGPAALGTALYGYENT